MAMGLALLYGIFRYDVLSLIPITYQAVFENIEDSVLLLDIDYHLIRYNKSAQKIFPELLQFKSGENLIKYFKIKNILYTPENKEQINNKYIFSAFERAE